MSSIATNSTASAPVSDDELDQMIWKLEREDMTPKMLSLMRELRQVRREKDEPVMYCSAETIACAKDGELLLRTLSSLSGDCVIPLYIAPPVPSEMNSDKAWGELKISAEDCQAWSEGWNSCRTAMLNAEKLNQPVSKTNKDE